MMREPIPFRPVRATLINGNGNGVHHLAEATDDDVHDDDYAMDDESDVEEERAELESAREVASNEAPWSPTPVRPARAYQRAHEDAQLNIVFPTVYEEDRTAKLKDLMTANAVSAITHQRMAEQMAKELGFEQYDYRAELHSIQVEAKKLSPDIGGSVDQIAGVNPQLQPGAQPPAGAPPGGVPGAPPSPKTRAKIGAPTPGLANDEDKDVPPRRADLSGPSVRAFKKQQRSLSSTESRRRRRS